VQIGRETHIRHDDLDAGVFQARNRALPLSPVKNRKNPQKNQKNRERERERERICPPCLPSAISTRSPPLREETRGSNGNSSKNPPVSRDTDSKNPTTVAAWRPSKFGIWEGSRWEGKTERREAGGAYVWRFGICGVTTFGINWARGISRTHCTYSKSRSAGLRVVDWEARCRG
jgi:hypothetical protein